MIKHYPTGKQSTHLHSLKPGDSVLFAPIKEISWTPNKHVHVALIAGGAGITPMYQLVRGILGNPDDHTRVTLVWGVNSDDAIFLKNELDELEHFHPDQFRAIYVVSDMDAESEHPKGYVTKEVLENAGLGVKVRGLEGGDVKVFVCGPPPMEKALTGSKSFFGGSRTGVLHELGFRPGDVHRF
jgi:cytochrome-b5 reductase